MAFLPCRKIETYCSKFGISASLIVSPFSQMPPGGSSGADLIILTVVPVVNHGLHVVRVRAVRQVPINAVVEVYGIQIGVPSLIIPGWLAIRVRFRTVGRFPIRLACWL